MTKRTELPWLSGLALALVCLFAVAPSSFADTGTDITLQGGDTSVNNTTTNGYEQPLANLSRSEALQQHELGSEGFRRNFARAAVGGAIRIGPKFNNVSCVSCHTHAGRGVPVFSRTGSQAVVKVSSRFGNPSLPGGPIPVPKLGLQLGDHAISGIKPDVAIRLSWQMVAGSYPDGTPYHLREPRLSIKPLGASVPRSIMTSLRRPPPVFGVGLLDAIDDESIQALADPSDTNHDGISGRINTVWDVVKERRSIGKFGWKAAAPTVMQQIATAYAADMGVSNPVMPPGAKKPDIDYHALLLTIFHSQTLAVPQARDQNVPAVIRGKEIFQSLQCNSCHIMTLITGRHDIPELSHQTIHPFTDLLLHDLGPGLADNRPEFRASGSEWRTPPLWGIGLTKSALNGGKENYLHDGRARTLEEAILWHGGEGKAARERFEQLSREDRAKLIEFLRSL